MTDLPISRAEGSMQTRAAIVAVAADMLAERGAGATSLREVAEAAGISRPGLLKHFPDKRSLLAEVAAAFAESASGLANGATDPWQHADRLLDGLPSYGSLTALMLHEALTSEPAGRRVAMEHHQWLSEHWDSASEDVIALQAGWEGLQIVGRYLPGVDVGQIFRTRALRPAVGPTTTLPPWPEPLPLDTVVAGPFGYAVGRARRAQIVQDAMDLFARNGYHGTTIRELAERVDVSPSTLLHHFTDKAGLLAEVLRSRDLQMVDRRHGEVLDAVEELGQLGAEAQRDEDAEPGLVSLYTVLSLEAIAPNHPAHEYFRGRFEHTVDYFENMFARAASQLGLSLDARSEAVWLVALWDGLQFRRLLSEDGLDLPERLDAHVAHVLRRERVDD